MKILSSSFCPVATIEVSVADSFCDMVTLYGFCPLEVGNGTGNFQDAAVGTGGKLQAFHGKAQEFAALCV